MAVMSKAAPSVIIPRSPTTAVVIVIVPPFLGPKCQGSALTHHPHIHMIVPGGGLSKDGKRWIRSRAKFLLPVRVLSKLFRRLFLDKLMALHRDGQLRFFGDQAPLADPKRFASFMASMRAKKWVVYAKAPNKPRTQAKSP